MSKTCSKQQIVVILKSCSHPLIAMLKITSEKLRFVSNPPRPTLFSHFLGILKMKLNLEDQQDCLFFLRYNHHPSPHVLQFAASY